MKLCKTWIYLTSVVFSLLSISAYSLPEHIHKIPLRLSPEYVYYATLGFGTNDQKIELLVDTGSQNIAVFCDLCTEDCLP